MLTLRPRGNSVPDAASSIHALLPRGPGTFTLESFTTRAISYFQYLNNIIKHLFGVHFPPTPVEIKLMKLISVDVIDVSPKFSLHSFVHIHFTYYDIIQVVSRLKVEDTY